MKTLLPFQENGERKPLYVEANEENARVIINRRKCFCLAGIISSICFGLASFTIYVQQNKKSGATLYTHGIIDRHPKLDSRLIFEENFDFLNEDVWTIEEDMGGGGNQEFQFYRNHPDNIGVADGKLYIQPGKFWEMGELETKAGTYDAKDVMLGTCEPFPRCAQFSLAADACTNPMWGGCNKTGGVPEGSAINPATSGRLNSKGKFSFQYGRAEVRARLPAGDWLWPAIWMLPTEDKYGTWPSSGEVDLVESRGNNASYTFKGKPAGRNFVGQTAHFGPSLSRTSDGWPHAHGEAKMEHPNDFTDEFYIYGFYWAEDAMYLYMIYPDGTEHMIVDLTDGFQNGFWHWPLGYEDTKWKGAPNPYEGHPVNAPYDQDFYFIMNVAVGGEIYWESPWDKDCWNPPYENINHWFYSHEHEWYPSWKEAGEKNKMEVDWIKVWQ